MSMMTEDVKVYILQWLFMSTGAILFSQPIFCRENLALFLCLTSQVVFFFLSMIDLQTSANLKLSELRIALNDVDFVPPIWKA